MRPNSKVGPATDRFRWAPFSFRIGAVTRNRAHATTGNANRWMFTWLILKDAATGYRLTTVFYLNWVYSLAIYVFSRATGLNKSCLNESVAMNQCNSSYRLILSAS